MILRSFDAPLETDIRPQRFDGWVVSLCVEDGWPAREMVPGLVFFGAQYIERSGAGAPAWRSSSALMKPPSTSAIVDR